MANEVDNEDEYTVIVSHARGAASISVNPGDTIADLKRLAAVTLGIPEEDLPDYIIQYKGRRFNDSETVIPNIPKGGEVKMITDVVVGD